MSEISKQFITKQKYHIKYFYMTMSSARNRYVYISMMTDDYQFVQFEFGIRIPNITPFVSSRLKQIFSDFYLDEKSRVIYDENFDRSHPLAMYLAFIHQHVQFTFRKVSLDTIVRRINTYHRYFGRKRGTSTVNQTFMQRLWRKLIQMKRCAWITLDVDKDLQLRSKAICRTLQICRLAMYYAVISEYLSSF